MSMQAHANARPAVAGSTLAAADPSATVQIELAGGGVMTISLAQALEQGLVSHAPNGSWTVIPGKASRLRMVAGSSAAGVIRPGQPVPPTGTHAILGMEEGNDSEKPKLPSEILGNIGSVTFLTRGLLSIAKGPGWPAWQTVYFAAHGLNRYTNHKLLPEWLAKGPVKDAMEYAIVGDMLVGSIRALPKANAGLIAAARGAGAVSGIGAKALAFTKGAFKKFPAEAVAPAVNATAKQAANVPFLAKLFPMMKPLYYIGMTAASVASVVGMTEYTHEHGTKGMLNTTTGRDAWIGALSGVAMLGSMYMPASPVQLYVDFASSALWMLQELNGSGVFDGLLGGDPKEPEAAKPADDATATATPAGDAAKPAAAAMANVAVAGMTPSSSVPTIAIPASNPARKRKHA